MTRRSFLSGAAAAALSVSVSPGRALAANTEPPPDIGAVAFDGFPILDPRPVFRLLGELAPGHGDALGRAFKTRLFEYQWLRALGGRYADFEAILPDALAAAARSAELELTTDAPERLLAAFRSLGAWPDARPTLEALRARGIGTAFLSNMTPHMLAGGIERGGLDGLFDHALSTDAIGSYKPDPRAYALGVEAFGLPKGRIAFVAFAGWDVAGASWFGYPTVWVNRLGASAERLDATPVATGPDLRTLLEWLGPADERGAATSRRWTPRGDAG